MLLKDQLRDKLLLENFIEYWLGLSKDELEAELGEVCANMHGFNQRNPHHCYTLWEHCVRTADNIKVYNKEDFLLKIAALFHDVGKPLVAMEKQGRLVFYGHAQKSAKIMETVLQGYGFSQEECFYILFWIKHHDDFISYTDEEEQSKSGGKVLITKQSIQKYLDRLTLKYGRISSKVMHVLLEKLFLLCIADVSSQSEFTYINGVLKDTKNDKMRRIMLIQTYILDLMDDEHCLGGLCYGKKRSKYKASI